jgi:cobalamin synthase
MLFHAAGVPDVIGALAGLAALTAASAALVERGLADSVDQWTRVRAGGQVGASVPAVLVLVFTTMIRAAAILVVPRSMWLWVFIATAVVGRWAAIFLQGLGDPIAHDESARSLVAVPAPAWLTAAISGGVVVLAVVALGKIGIVAMALAAVAVFALGLATQRREGGLSPGVVAAAAAIGELLVLLVATVR